MLIRQWMVLHWRKVEMYRTSGRNLLFNSGYGWNWRNSAQIAKNHEAWL